MLIFPLVSGINFHLLFNSGSKHQELQVSALADVAELQQSAPPAVDGHTATELPHGAVVAHALPHATRVPVSPRVQGVVLQPAVWHDRGQPRVQREPRQTPPQGQTAAQHMF